MLRALLFSHRQHHLRCQCTCQVCKAWLIDGRETSCTGGIVMWSYGKKCELVDLGILHEAFRELQTYWRGLGRLSIKMSWSYEIMNMTRQTLTFCLLLTITQVCQSAVFSPRTACELFAAIWSEHSAPRLSHRPIYLDKRFDADNTESNIGRNRSNYCSCSVSFFRQRSLKFWKALEVALLHFDFHACERGLRWKEANRE